MPRSCAWCAKQNYDNGPISLYVQCDECEGQHCMDCLEYAQYCANCELTRCRNCAKNTCKICGELLHVYK